jgi:hypothetical protein
MGSPEAVCERIGSLMHMQWAATRHTDAGALMDEVLLRDAKVSCIGHPRDEAICLDVAKAMLAMGRRPKIAERSRAKQTADGIATSHAVDRARQLQVASLMESGRHNHLSDASSESELGDDNAQDSSDDCLGEWSTLGSLRAAMAARTDKSHPSLDVPELSEEFCDKSRGGRVEGLPLFYEDPRRVERCRADSVKRSALATWLDSEDGQAWRAAKHRRQND